MVVSKWLYPVFTSRTKTISRFVSHIMLSLWHQQHSELDPVWGVYACYVTVRGHWFASNHSCFAFADRDRDALFDVVRSVWYVFIIFLGSTFDVL